MPREPNLQAITAPFNGLVTDMSPLTFPENAFTEGWDIVVDERGRLTRRLGFEYEENYSTNSITHTTSGQIRAFEWGAVSGDGAINFLVVQIDATIHFFLMPTDGTAVSANKKSFTIDLNVYKVSGATGVEGEDCVFASGNGVLLAAHPKCSPFYVEYDVSGDSITVTPIQIKIRDFEGLNDGLDIDERPSTLDDEHHYNLDNQGWGQNVIDDAATVRDAITEWDSLRTDFPSNADIWWLFKNADDEFDPGTGTASSASPEKQGLGNTPAPKGHFLLNPFYEDRTDVSGIGAFTVVSTMQRPSTVAFYAGRAFYSGVADTGWNNNIYYSQTIINDDEYGKCYQRNDPTSEHLSDLLDTDGGVVKISEAGTILHLHPIGPFLLVFATNGIWSISGPDQNNFKATDFSISKVTDESIISTHSIVSVGGIPYWWNNSGIFKIDLESTLLSLSVTRISQQRISVFFNDIPASEIQYVSGAYNPRTNILTWLYRSTSTTTTSQHHIYDKALNLNLITNAFYPWTISQPTNGPQVNGVFTTNKVQTATAYTYFLTLIPVSGSTYNLTFSRVYDTDYLDWTTFDSTGTDYSSYCVTGYGIAGGAFLDFASNYVVFVSETETNASCIVRGVWSYANSPDSGKYTVGQQIYPGNSNVDYQEVRLKIRGEGRALQLRFESETGKPFTVVGFVVFLTRNQGP